MNQEVLKIVEYLQNNNIIDVCVILISLLEDNELCNQNDINKIFELLNNDIYNAQFNNSHLSKEDLLSGLWSVIKRRDNINRRLHSSIFDAAVKLLVNTDLFWNKHEKNKYTASQRKLDELEKTCNNDIIRYGDTPYAHVALGSINHMRCNYKDAELYFTSSVNSVSSDINLRHYNLGAYSYLAPTLNNLITDRKNDYSLKCYIIENKVDIKSNYTILYSCDDRYYDAFALGVISSLLEFQHSFTVFFHLSDSEKDCELVLSELTDMAPDFKFYVLCEPKITQHPKPYYAMGRMRIADLALITCETDLLIFDIDMKFNKDPDEFIGKYRAHDICLVINSRYGTHLPWLTVSAGSIFIKNNFLGKMFSEFLSCYAELFCRNGSIKYWWADQNLLYTVFILFNRIYPEASIASMRNKGMPWVHDISYKTSCLYVDL